MMESALALPYRETNLRWGVGDKVANPGEAVDILDLIEDHQGKDFSHPGNSTKQVNCHRVMVGNLGVDLPFYRKDLLVDCIHERNIHLDAGANHGVGESFCYTDTI
jgi:hypothetical protein